MDKAKNEVTTEALRSMSLGETRTFKQKDAAGIESARALACRASRLMGCRYTTMSDYANNTISITREL